MRTHLEDTRVIRNVKTGLFLSLGGKEVAEYPDAAKYPTHRKALNALKRQPEKFNSDDWLISLAHLV